MKKLLRFSFAAIVLAVAILWLAGYVKPLSVSIQGPYRRYDFFSRYGLFEAYISTRRIRYVTPDGRQTITLVKWNAPTAGQQWPAGPVAISSTAGRRFPAWLFITAYNLDEAQRAALSGGPGPQVVVVWAYGYYTRVILVRGWPIVVGLTLIFVVGSYVWQKRRSERPGHCVHCGYDLRASPERCPECGVAVTPA